MGLIFVKNVRINQNNSGSDVKAIKDEAWHNVMMHNRFNSFNMAH